MKLDNSLYFPLFFVGSFIANYLILPKIIGVLRYKQLMKDPNERSSHKESVPSLGGISFFIVLTIGLYFLQDADRNSISMSIIPGLVILFIMGMKDDLVVLSSKTKFITEIVAVSFVFFHPSFQILNLDTFFGFGQVSSYIAIPLALVVCLFIINAYNLIDGIDGLAAMIGMVIFACYAVMFYLLNLPFFMGLSVIALGTLTAFLCFNLSRKNKIFMGDTGSLIIGFLIAVATIRFFTVDPVVLSKLPFRLDSLSLVMLAVLIVPIFDTSRVIVVRLLNGKTPFSADRNHIHHILIDQLRFSHVKASVCLAMANILIVALFVILGRNFDSLIALGVMITLVGTFTYFFYNPLKFFGRVVKSGTKRTQNLF